MEQDLLEEFGEIIKISRNSGVRVFNEFTEKAPKKPDEGELAILELIRNSNKKQLQLIQQATKYCVELSLYKLLNIMEYGVEDYSFELVIKKGGNKSLSLINDKDDNELSTNKFFNYLR